MVCSTRLKTYLYYDRSGLMNVIDIILLIMIAAAIGAAVRKCISDRKNGRSCCGNCSCCDKCTKM